MAAERRIRLVIHIVLDQEATIRQSGIFQGLLQNAIAGPIGGHEIDQSGAFRRGVLEMSHVQINPAGIGQEAAVAGWFVVPAMMKIQHASLLHLEDMIPKSVGDPRWGMFGPILIDQESVFGFQSKNLIQHSS